MTGKQHRNVDGLALTAAGRIDQRQFNRPTLPNDGFATHVYDVLHRPNDKLPWHVVENCLADGTHVRISRHSKESAALKRLEIERLKQPNRRANAKARHKLGIADNGE